MIRIGSEVEVRDFGTFELDELGEYVVFLCEGRDASINWAVASPNIDESVLEERRANLIKVR